MTTETLDMVDVIDRLSLLAYHARGLEFAIRGAGLPQEISEPLTGLICRHLDMLLDLRRDAEKQTESMREKRSDR